MKKDASVPAGDTARRVREMLACGVTIDELARESGLRSSLLRALPRYTGEVPRHVARAVELADEALMGPPPPRDDVDEVVVERLIAGTHTGPSRPAERRAAILALRASGVSVKQTAIRLGLNEQTVWRKLRDLGLTTPRAA